MKYSFIIDISANAQHWSSTMSEVGNTEMKTKLGYWFINKVKLLQSLFHERTCFITQVTGSNNVMYSHSQNINHSNDWVLYYKG